MAGTTVLKEREQHTRRRGMKKQDDHGRIWNCETDIEDEHSGWINATLDGKYNPPIDIPRKYLKRGDPDNVFRMVINYDQWKIDWREATAWWKTKIRMIAADWHPREAGQFIANPTPDMIKEAGPEPIPLDFIKAMEAGNKWALGIPKPDGTYYPRPAWATDAMWEQYQLLRQSHWTPGEDIAIGETDASKYVDEEEPVQEKPKAKKAAAPSAAA